MKKYYACVDGELIVPLGECDSFDEADEKAPPCTTWIYDEEGLRALGESIMSVMNLPISPARLDCCGHWTRTTCAAVPCGPMGITTYPPSPKPLGVVGTRMPQDSPLIFKPS